jgi:hypothetical protein
MVSDKEFVLSKRIMRMLKGSTSSSGCQTVSLCKDKVGKSYCVHVIVACAHIDNHDGFACVDHIDHDKNNNDVSNLRWSTHSQNLMNMSKRSNTSSTYKGVCWEKQAQKWRANIRLDGKTKHLGRFENEVQAAVAYNDAAIQYFTEFACLNVIPVESVIDI